MVFMLRLIPGLLLLLYTVETAEITKPILNINSLKKDDFQHDTNDTLYTKSDKGKITDRDIENIVKPFKFQTTNPENSTSLKLGKSESYTTDKSAQETSRTGGGRFVDLDIDKFISTDFHNAVYTFPTSTNTKPNDEENYSQHSTEEASSFENLAVLTTPKTPFFDQKFKETVESVNKNIKDAIGTDSDNITQSTNHSSNNFIDDSDESNSDTKLGYRIYEGDYNGTTNPLGTHHDTVKEKRITISYESKRNVSTTYDETTPNEDSNELHKENDKFSFVDENINELKKIEATTSSQSSSSYPTTTTIRYTITKPSTDRSDVGIISNKIESETVKSERASTSTTSDEPKTDISTSRFNTPRRGSIKFADYQKRTSTVPMTTITTNPTTTTSPLSTTTTNKTFLTTPTTPNNLEQVVQENQVIPIQVTPPTTLGRIETKTTTDFHSTSEITQAVSSTYEKTTPTIDKTTSTTEETTSTTIKTDKTATKTSSELKNSTENLDEQQSTTFYVFVQPDTTTNDNTPDERTTGITSSPRGFTAPTSTEPSTTSNGLTVSKIREILTSTARGFEVSTTITTEKDPTTTNIFNTSTTTEDSISSSFTGFKMAETTEQIIPTTIPTNRETMTTTAKPEITTLEVFTETTTQERSTVDKIKTTETELYPDNYTETTTSFESTQRAIEENETTTSTVHLDATTSNEPRSSKEMKFPDTTTFFPTTFALQDTTTTRESAENITNFSIEVTSEKELQLSTISIKPITESTLNDASSEFTREQTSEATTRTIIESSPTKTLLENQTTQEKVNEEPKTTPTTIGFVHIKNIDRNHTTLLPDVLRPNERYGPEDVSETIVKTTETYATDETPNPSELDGHGRNNGAIVAIVISCIGGICLVVLAGLLVVMRNRQKRFNYGQRCRPIYPSDLVDVSNSVRRKTAIRGSKRSYGNPAFDDPVCLSHPLNFPAIARFAANIEDVYAEFNDIPQISAVISELPEGCETKNRYANVIPLPETRVFLNPVEGYPNSDYINANYVTGPRSIRKYYIACQAPMSNTVDDFWRMIWEQQCKVVLMLTHLFENGTEKCFDYLPPSEVLDCHRLFGDYQVTLKKREVKEKYIISNIQLKNMVSNSWREVTHFWYMGWPEKGVPAEANSIIAFLIEARSYMKSATIDKKNIVNGELNGTSETDVNPVVVHCSPGTGRTGAVITCDIAIREFEQTRQVDIPKIVYRIRRDRASAVQTKEQYAFIYKVIDVYATKLAGGSLESIL